MGKVPLREDDQSEEPGVPPSPRRRPIAVERQLADYYSDEHPEIPKIKRASLYLDQEPLASSSGKRARLTPPVADDEHGVPPTPHTTNKIMVAPRKRPGGAYEPPATASHHPHKRRKRQQLPTILRQIQRVPYYRRWLFGLLICLALFLILLPIIANLSATVGSNRGNSLVQGTVQPNGNDTSINRAVPTDPHELVTTPPNNNRPAPPVFATSAYLMDADTGATLYATNPFLHLPMLSTTKLMTALLATEAGNPDRSVKIDDAIGNDLNQLAADSSLMNAKRGETYTLRDLLYGLLLPSGNDAAVVIADAVGGNLQNFVAKMNQRAAQLGLHDTHYVNPHGLLAVGQYSSAHDLAVLAKYALSVPMLHQISSTKTYHIAPNGDHAEHFFSNGDQFSWWYPGVDGGKTGWDAGSDFVQVISCIRNNHHLIGVVMHTIDWWTDMRDLMNWGFSTFNWLSPRDATATTPIPFAADWNYFARDKKSNTVPIENLGRYYVYTGYSISGMLMNYFDQNGGLTKFGYPTEQPKVISDTVITQRFEHTSIACDLSSKKCKLT